jgi:hypothetical protein
MKDIVLYNNVKKVINYLLIILFVLISSSCKKDSPVTSEVIDYGVPGNIKLDVPCPGNGTWITDSPRHAKTASAAPQLYANRVDGKIVLHDWLLDIYTMDWKNTGLCTTVSVGWVSVTACDYEPFYTGEVIRAYLDPHSCWQDADGNCMYTGYTKSGIEIHYWDYRSSEKVLYMNFKVANGWFQQTLTPFQK